MIDTIVKLNQIIDQEILVELLNSFAKKYQLTVGIYNAEYKPEAIAFAPNCNPDLHTRLNESLSIPLAQLHTRSLLSDGKTVYLEIENGNIDCVYFNIDCDNHPLMIVGILNAYPDQLASIESKNPEPDITFNNLPVTELIEPIDNIKKDLAHFTESGWQRYKLFQNTKEETTEFLPPEMPVEPKDETDVDSDNYLIFTTAEHIVIDATPSVLKKLGYINSSTLIGQNLISHLDSISNDKNALFKIKNKKQEWLFSTLKVNGYTFSDTKIRVIPQLLNDSVLGYEYHFHFNKISKDEQPKHKINFADIVQEPENGSSLSAPLTNSHTELEPPYSEFVKAMPYPVIVLDEQDKICIWNREIENIFDQTNAEMIGQDFKTLLDENSQSVWKEIKSKKLDKKNPDHLFTFVLPTGSKISMQLAIRKSFINNNPYLLVTLLNIADQENTTEFETNDISRQLLSNQTAIVTSLNGKILYITDNACQFLKAEKDELLNKNLSLVLTEDIDKLLNQSRNISKSTTQTIIAQCTQDILDGQIIQLHVKKLLTPEKTLLQLDLSKAPEKAEKLSKNTINKTEKLELLQHYFTSIAKNFDFISSELYHNTSSILLDKDINDETRSNIVNIKKLAKKTSVLKQELYYFSNLEKPYMDQIDLNKKIKSWDKTLNNMVPENMTIELNLRDNIGKIQVNNKQLKHILKTLLQNAAKSYSNGGKIIIHTRQHHVQSNQDLNIPSSFGRVFIVLEIIDTGRGIPLSIRDQLFEPFVSTNPKDFGKGMGLASVYGIMKNHNGFITIKTLDNQGTIVSLYFPVIERNKDGKENELVTRQKILLIDDDPGIIEVNSITLKHFGFDTYSGETANQGIELLKQHKAILHLAILDISLPDMEGIDCAKEMLKIKPDLPIIISSGYHCNDEYYKFIQQTDSVFLQKPYTSNKLYQTIQSLLARKKHD